MDDKSRRQFLKQFAVLSAGASTFLITGCPMYGPPCRPDYGREFSSPADELGNLFVRNSSRSRIALYDRESMLKVVWRNSALYRVNVPINVMENNYLSVYFYSDTGDQNDFPPPSEVLKRWSVKMPSQISETPNYIWLIDSSPTKDCGEILFNYKPENDIIVDVQINAWEDIKTTERVLPGKSIHLGMAYGEYTIEYIYYLGRAPKVGERTELGRIASEIVNGEEVPIKTTLDAQHSMMERTIPNWEG